MQKPLAFKYMVLSLGLFLMSCGSMEQDEQDLGEPLARVGDKILYEKEVHHQIPSNLAEQDSINILNSLIKEWLDEQILCAHAEKKLTDNDLNFDKQIERYRNSLILFRFESLYLDNNLDTAVSDDEIAAFYENNKKNFILSEGVRRIRFLASDSTDMFNYRYVTWLRSDENVDLNRLEAKVYQKNYFYVQSSPKWYSNSELSELIHVSEQRMDRVLKYFNRKIYTKYYRGKKLHLFVEEQRLSGDFKPLQFIRNEIKLQIINERKIALLKKLKTELINTALNNKDAEILN